MKKLITPALILLSLILKGQSPIVADHQCLDLSLIPVQWIDSAKAKLFIGYGHTSHGEQIGQGMNAIVSYFNNDIYSWSHDGAAGTLHMFEGPEYDPGYLQLDAGYEGWSERTDTFLTDFPDCNVIMWSWCGQVNDVELHSHYLEPMQQLETKYPDVKFVYMTGHLEGTGPNSSLSDSNQAIRDYCMQNNKVLFDFEDIERYDPDNDVDYEDLFGTDGCLYEPTGGGEGNWSDEWMAANPTHELTSIANECTACTHSGVLNCAKKGVAAWYLWAQLAGWNSPISSAHETVESTDQISLFPNPMHNTATVVLPYEMENVIIRIVDLQGKLVYNRQYSGMNKDIELLNTGLANGIYLLQVNNPSNSFQLRLIAQ